MVNRRRRLPLRFSKSNCRGHALPIYASGTGMIQLSSRLLRVNGGRRLPLLVLAGPRGRGKASLGSEEEGCVSTRRGGEGDACHRGGSSGCGGRGGSPSSRKPTGENCPGGMVRCRPFITRDEEQLSSISGLHLGPPRCMAPHFRSQTDSHGNVAASESQITND
jgi:hypothetical protein